MGLSALVLLRMPASVFEIEKDPPGEREFSLREVFKLIVDNSFFAADGARAGSI